MTARKPYRSDLSDAEWAVIEPELAACREPRLARKVSSNQALHDLREIVNAILYVNRTGCAWEYLPHDFPPFKTVYGYFAAWCDDGTTEHIHDLLRRRLRRARGRTEEPSAVAIDSQTVKAAANAQADTVGYDGNNYQGSSVMPGRVYPAWWRLARLGVIAVSARVCGADCTRLEHRKGFASEGSYFGPARVGLEGKVGPSLGVAGAAHRGEEFVDALSPRSHFEAD